MSTFDIVLVIMLGIGAFKGFQQGLVVEVLSFLAFFIGIFFAIQLTLPVTVWLFDKTDNHTLWSILVFIGIFVLLVVSIRVGAKLIKNALDLTFFGTLDNFFGAVAGLLKWAFVISVFFWVIMSIGFIDFDRYTEKTVIFPYIEGIAPFVFDWVGYLIPTFQDLLRDMEDLSRKDSMLALWL